MALSLGEDGELRRRIVAAAALQGLGMRGVRQALEDYGAPQTLAEAMVRGEQPQGRRQIRDLSDALGVPQWWFYLDADDFAERLERDGALNPNQPPEAWIGQIDQKLADLVEEVEGLKAGQIAAVAQLTDLLGEISARAERVEDRLQGDG